MRKRAVRVKCLCFLCLSHEAGLYLDKKGRPYMRCSECNSIVFPHSTTAMRNLELYLTPEGSNVLVRTLGIRPVPESVVKGIGDGRRREDIVGEEPGA